MTKIEFATRLKELRASTGLSQVKFCNEVGIGERLYVFYETETHSSVPTYKNLIKMANYLNCSIDYLLCQTDKPKRYPKKN